MRHRNIARYFVKLNIQLNLRTDIRNLLYAHYLHVDRAKNVYLLKILHFTSNILCLTFMF
jgi:hypothetical protein